MKEIKFRVWDKKRKRMLTNGICVGFGINGQYVLDADDRNWEGDITWIYEKNITNNLSPDDFVIMQYTGLKDRDGCEIYEGDLVELITLEGVYEIVYNEYYARFVCRNIKDDGGGSLFEGVVKRVIGNIYETKDAINKQKEDK